MEHILDETVPAEDLKRFEQKYHEELQHGKVVIILDCYDSPNLYFLPRSAPPLSLNILGAW